MPVSRATLPELDGITLIPCLSWGMILIQLTTATPDGLTAPSKSPAYFREPTGMHAPAHGSEECPRLRISRQDIPAGEYVPGDIPPSLFPGNVPACG